MNENSEKGKQGLSSCQILKCEATVIKQAWYLNRQTAQWNRNGLRYKKTFSMR